MGVARVTDTAGTPGEEGATSPADVSDELKLDFHGVQVRCTGDADGLRGLGIHFASFLGPCDASTGASPDLHVTLRRAEPPQARHERRRCDQIVDRGIVYNFGDTTVVDHHGVSRSEYDFATERGTVTSPHVQDLVELGYLMVHSRIGVLLEQRGLVRLHCVGVEHQGRAALILAPSGGGKSTLARSLLEHTPVRLLGDDMVLIDRRGQALPFHSPLGVTDPRQAHGLGEAIPFNRRKHPDKWVVALDGLESRLARGPVPVAVVLWVVRVSGGASAVVSASRTDMARALGRDMVVGLGLPQVIELVARRGARDLAKQLPSVRRRAWAAAQLLRARGGVLELSDPTSAAHAVFAALSPKS